MGILVQTTAQVTKCSAENRKRLAISLATLLINFVVALWAFSRRHDIQQNQSKIVIFNIVFIFTGILSPYANLSILVPEWFTWHGFVIICAFVTIVKGYNVIVAWFKQKVVLAVRYKIDKLWVLVFGMDQLPIVVGVGSNS